MKNTDEIQENPGSGLLARPLHFKKRREWIYSLRQSTKSKRQGVGAGVAFFNATCQIFVLVEV